jgi:hypothetical protein
VKPDRLGKNRLQPFYKELRDLGFKRAWETNSVLNGFECEYHGTYTGLGVEVHVQLWISTDTRIHMRASNKHPYIYPNGNRSDHSHMDSYPSEFSTVEGMRKAVEFERTRWVNGVDKREQRNFG